MEKDHEAFNSELIIYKIEQLTVKVDSMQKTLEHGYVTSPEFEALKEQVRGIKNLLIYAGSAIGLALIAAIMKLILK